MFDELPNQPTKEPRPLKIVELFAAWRIARAAARSISAMEPGARAGLRDLPDDHELERLICDTPARTADDLAAKVMMLHEERHRSDPEWQALFISAAADAERLWREART